MRQKQKFCDGHVQFEISISYQRARSDSQLSVCVWDLEEVSRLENRIGSHWYISDIQSYVIG